MNYKRQLQFILGIWLLLLSPILQACASGEPTPPEPTFTLAAPDYVLCPQVTPIAFTATDKPKVIYVLIDRSGSYGAYTGKAVDILIEGLMMSIEPGDRLNLIWLGSTEDESRNWLVDIVPTIDHPLLTPPISTLTPIPLLTSTPVSVGTPATSTPTPLAILDRQDAAQKATADAQYQAVTADASRVIATNTAIQIEKDHNQQRCDQAVINNHNQKLINAWQKQKSQVIEDFRKKTLEPLRNSTEEGKDLATHLYNSLYYAARTIRQEKDTDLYRAYYLIILSDMEDAGSLDGEALSVDLTDAHVLMAMVFCKQSIDCQKRSDYWATYFRDRGAILPANPVRLVDETTPYVISDFLR
jgi:hypothetical protein